MKTLPSIAMVLLVLCLSAPLLAYGRSPLDARKELIQLNIPYNVGAFIHSAKQGDNVAVQLFLEAGMDVNTRDTDGMTALARAAEQGHIHTMQLLLRAGADRRVALERAAHTGAARSVQVLLEAGVDTLAKTTALLFAADRGRTAIVQTLLAAGADAQASIGGWTALMLAAKNGHGSVVPALLAAGADVHAKDEYGWQALMYAAWEGHAPVVQALLIGSANVQAQTNAGDNALTLASVQEHLEVIRVLKEAGAQWSPGIRKPEIRGPKTPSEEYLQELRRRNPQWQQANLGLRQMGLDMETRQYIRMDDVPKEKAVVKLSPPQIRQAQEHLKAQGFDPGPIDGVPGLRTTEALRQYQAKQNLPVTGKLDETTLKTLGVP